jgi:TPP-dependent indolepyruvate ferredoxin oxidoreductase alpha subunit
LLKQNTKWENKISGAEAVIRCLLEEGVNLVYGYPGGTIMPVYDELYKFKMNAACFSATNKGQLMLHRICKSNRKSRGDSHFRSWT